MSDRNIPNDQKLAPCPFCGSSNVRIYSLDDEADYVQCTECWCTGPTAMGEPYAASAWNQRAHVPALKEIQP